jgi:hypothetical protein
LPPDTNRRKWAVPLSVDGRRVRLAGDLWRVPAPALWPWIALGLPFIVLTGLALLSGRSPLIRAATLVFGVAAGVATIAIAMGFMFVSNASEGRWVEGGNELVFAVVGLALVARGSADARVASAGALGLLGITVGVSKLSVLLHGVVLSALPATVARGTVALAIWAGAAACRGPKSRCALRLGTDGRR